MKTKFSTRSGMCCSLAAAVVALSMTSAIAAAQETTATKPATRPTITKTEATDIVPPTVTFPTEDEIKAVESKLADAPSGMGRPITDRVAWQALAATKAYKDAVAEAEKLLNKPLREISDDLFLEYSRTGDRNKYQTPEFERRGRMRPLVLAECVENKGRFLPKIEELIGVICAERTWVLPAHDRNLLNFHGERIYIDLFSADVASMLATTDWLLGDKLSPATRQAIRQNIRKRVLDPFKAIFTDPLVLKDSWWITAQHNWNAVCLAGVTGAAMEQIASKRERAEYLAAAVKYSEYYFKGYGTDGYCSEGLGYWNYGFGHYVLLTETTKQATGGAIDLYDRPLAREVAMFARKLEIMADIWPAFSDCAPDAKPDANLMYYINRHWGLGLNQHQELRYDGRLFEMVIFTFNTPTRAAAKSAATAPAGSLRDYFDKAGILVCRPAAGSSCRIGAALKGGNNNEAHNHNDLGSYVVVTGKTAVLLDVGAERYTARTFSAQRYESKFLNSYGHPVPVVAGQLQAEGAKSQAKILKAEFSDEVDVFEMDIRSAYPKANIDSLVRTFVYSRKGAGSLSVTDQVKSPSPQTFGTALMTAGTCTQMADGSLLVQSGKDALKVTIDTAGEPFKLNIEPIKEDAKLQPTRIGIDLTNPVSAAKITVKIEPAAAK